MKKITIQKLLIIITNLMPLFSLFYKNTQAEDIILLYVLESIIIGIFIALKMTKVKDNFQNNTTSDDNDLDIQKMTKKYTIIFFLFHYNFACFWFIFFVYITMKPTHIFIPILILTIINISIKYLYTYLAEFLKEKKYEQTNLNRLFVEPYKKILPLLISIFLAFPLIIIIENKIYFLLFFVAIKIFIEIKYPKLSYI